MCGFLSSSREKELTANRGTYVPALSDKQQDSIVVLSTLLVQQQ